MKAGLLKGFLVVVGALVLSTIGIYASDRLQGIQGGLGQIAGTGGVAICSEGSVLTKIDGDLICVDVYEASPSEKCPHKTPTSVIQSEQNARMSDCYAASVKDATPWSYISLAQAQRMCASAGKRLPTSDEWYHLALGTDERTCVIHENGTRNTGVTDCISGIGVHDSIGNVWEWTEGEVSNGVFEDRQLPEEGYVTSVDTNGLALTSAKEPDELYGNDYFWSKKEGVFGMIRGGFYGSNDDAGLYTVNASVPTSFAAQGVGFRCVEDILE